MVGCNMNNLFINMILLLTATQEWVILRDKKNKGRYFTELTWFPLVGWLSTRRSILHRINVTWLSTRRLIRLDIIIMNQTYDFLLIAFVCHHLRLKNWNILDVLCVQYQHWSARRAVTFALCYIDQLSISTIWCWLPKNSLFDWLFSLICLAWMSEGFIIPGHQGSPYTNS